MYPRTLARRFARRTAFAVTISISLFSITTTPWLVSSATQTQSHGAGRTGRPTPGKPEGALPNLDDVQNESQLEREPLAPIASTVRSQKNEGKPWDGRRVGDPHPPSDVDQVANRTGRGGDGSTINLKEHRQARRAHARRGVNSLPPVLDNQFVLNFFTWALLRNPTSNETTYWYDHLRVAHSQGQVSQKLATIEFGKTLFESAEYAARNRDAHWYVYDLYKTYLMRDPDASGWAMWQGLVPTHGREYVRRGFEESTEFATLIANIVPNGSATINAASLISARVDPRNRPGNGMLTRDAAWSVPLLSLPGRNGLDLGLALSYSSMVWTRSGPYIYFDEDNGFPSPGFRLGFPTVQRKVFDAQTARNTYLFITPAGHRIELRQVGSSNIYEAADSSYLQLTENGTSLLVRSTDGTQLRFTEANGEYRCTQIKDRNGNYIAITYDALGHITNVSDTLGRVIVFNYDSNANLLSITQSWNGQPSHQWVSFGWGTRTMQSSFSGAAVVGTANGMLLPVITQVAFNDTSHLNLEYTNSLQLSVVRNYFGALERNSTTFTYETPAGDVPRLLNSGISAHNWTGVNGVPSQVITQYGVDADGACVLSAPDGTIYKEYYGTGWQRGLTTRSEVLSGGEVQKWTTTAWTQDNTSVNYEFNPRVTETNVYDRGGQNRRRTVIDYGPYAQYGLPYGVREYDGETEIRQTFTDYNLSPAYLERRIIGLVSQVHLSNVSQWQSKTTYAYDDPSRLEPVPVAATQHDTTYSSSFTARGNVTAVSRWDVNDINNATKKLTTYTNYYNTGTPSSITDSAQHQSSISYTDSFSDNVNRNAFAYPTRVTDADGFSSYVQYNFDFGAATRTQSPTPAGQSQGAIQVMTYNNLGQLERTTTANNGAYRRFWYGPNYTASYATVNNIADESYSTQVKDGLGRVIGVANNHPGSSGGYRLITTIYDLMGQAVKQSNPTEINNSWVPSGDDVAGIYYNQQTYDWQGRPRVTTHPDNTTRSLTYGGCGCAGKLVVTNTDEVGRRQKIYSDVLGRHAKFEVLDWNGNVYSTRTNTYNARDQIENVRQYQGPESSGIYQQITKSYDGYGRLVSQKDPIQTTATLYTYNADSQPLTVTDARGVKQTFTYNKRDLPTSVSYSGWNSLPPVTIAYDGAGNRTSMNDGTGSRTYQYNQLSQLTSETRQFTGLGGSFNLNYEYNLMGSLKAFTDHTGSRVGYAMNAAGMLTSINGSGAHSVSTYASNFAYRASGAIKAFDYGNGVHQHLNSNSRLRNTSVTLTLGSNNFGWSFDYHADGKLQKVTDFNNPIFDRAFSYDHVGRLQEARTGSEARGGNTQDGPFKQSYSYDVWENTTSRTDRAWTNSATQSAGFTNNRHPNFSYDNEGNLLGSFDASYGYDAGGRQNAFMANVFIGGGPPSYSLQSVLEVSQTFDGDSAPAKKTTVNRWEELVVEEIQIREYTATIYYLRSTALGGQVVAELDETGYKRRGYVLAGGMRLATQNIGNPGYGSHVSWTSTSPATGSEYMPDVSLLGRKELDPLGNDVTQPPEPTIVPEPVFYNPKFDQMPLLLEGGPSEEYQRANADWARLVGATFQAIHDREQAETLWQSGKRSEAMAILMKNPNVGIEYRAIYKNEVIRSGSYFGKAAADFLNGINIAVSKGWLSPVTGSASANLVGAYSIGASPQELEKPPLWPEGKPFTLSKCLQWLLAPYFKAAGEFRGLDLSEIKLFDGLPKDTATRIFLRIDPQAITYGNSIYFAPDAYSASLSGIKLIAHELTHVKQYRLHGLIGFGAQYGKEFRANRKQGMTNNEAHRNISFELAATQYAATVTEAISKQYGDYPCDKYKP
jgi:YD repeat-containing protein